METMIAAASVATDRGDIHRQHMLEVDDAQRWRFEASNRTNNPIATLTAAERSITFGDMPHYTQLQHNDDELFESLACLISLDVPSIHDMVHWQGHI
jgi:hypothetical protein